MLLPAPYATSPSCLSPSCIFLLSQSRNWAVGLCNLTEAWHGGSRGKGRMPRVADDLGLRCLVGYQGPANPPQVASGRPVFFVVFCLVFLFLRWTRPFPEGEMGQVGRRVSGLKCGHGQAAFGRILGVSGSCPLRGTAVFGLPRSEDDSVRYPAGAETGLAAIFRSELGFLPALVCAAPTPLLLPPPRDAPSTPSPRLYMLSLLPLSLDVCPHRCNES